MIYERDFADSPAAVSEARRYTLDALRGVSKPVIEATLVMVSELASNCIRHASERFNLVIARTDDEIRVEVSDAGPGRPSVRRPPDAEPSGRGLQIVSALADRWGVRVKPGSAGKTVWFVVGV